MLTCHALTNGARKHQTAKGNPLQYRPMGATGLDFSVVSFGAMRIPHITMEEAVAVVHHAVEAGINHFETSPGYGDSEDKLGEALHDRREGLIISTKSHALNERTADDLRRKMDESLKRLRVDHLEFYQMWGVNTREIMDIVLSPGGPLEGAKKARDEGIVDHIGFTTHAPHDIVTEMIETGEFESVTLSYNLIKRHDAPMIDLAARHNMGVVIMNPLGGGLLGTPSERFLAAATGVEKTTAGTALRYLLAHEHITCAIVGFHYPWEVDELTALCERFPGPDEAERRRMEQVVDELEKPECTACGYCRPCPQEIKVPAILITLQHHRIHGFHDWARKRYPKFKKTIEDCIDCGQCEEKCPQKLPIRDLLRQAHEELSTQPAETGENEK